MPLLYQASLVNFDCLIFLTGSNWILHIISELIFADSKKKYEYPEFPILECGDPEKYQVSLKQPLHLSQIIKERFLLFGDLLVLSSERKILIIIATYCVLTISPALFRDYLILLQNNLITMLQRITL